MAGDASWAEIERSIQRLIDSGAVEPSVGNGQVRALRKIRDFAGISADEILNRKAFARIADDFIADTSDVTGMKRSSRRTYVTRVRKALDNVTVLPSRPGPNAVSQVTAQRTTLPNGQQERIDLTSTHRTESVPVSFTLRHDHVVKFELPTNLTPREAERLATVIKMYVVDAPRDD